MFLLFTDILIVVSCLDSLVFLDYVQCFGTSNQMKINTWGYSTINFFAPMSRYSSAGGGPVNASREFKEMVKALHDAGIEVGHTPFFLFFNLSSLLMQGSFSYFEW